MTAPQVSVFIASYNHGRFLPETLESVLSQRGPELELVVVDDGSTDDSVEVLRAFALRDPRLRWSQHDNGANLGVSVTSNRAVGLCRAPFLAWLGSDDVLTAGSVARRYEVLRASPAAGLVYGRATVSDKRSEKRRTLGRNVNRHSRPLATLVLSNCIPASTVMLRREALDEVGLFNEEIVSSDRELWLRVVARWNAAFIPEPLARYRIHGENLNAGLDVRSSSRRTVETLGEVAKWAGTAEARRKEPALEVLVDLQLSYHRFASGDAEGAAGELRGLPSRLESGKPITQALDLWTWHLASAPAGKEYVEWLSQASTVDHLPWEVSSRLQRLAPVFPPLWEAWRQRRAGDRETARRLFFAAACRRPALVRDPVVRRFTLEHLLPAGFLRLASRWAGVLRRRR